MIRSASASASASVLPRIGETTNSTLQSSGLRPLAAMRARTSSRYSFIPSMPVATAMIESALRDANARPRGEAPACTNTGWPCGDRTVFSGPRDPVVLPDEVADLHLRVVGVGVGLAVHHDRFRIPRVPQLAHDVEVLVGQVVALVVLGQRVHAEVLGGAVLGGADDVPAEAAPGHGVDRRRHPGQHPGRVEAGRHGGDDAEPLGRVGEHRGQRHRVVLGREHGVLERALHGAAVRVRHHAGVLEDDVVEARPLERLGERHEEVAGEVGAVR